MAETKLKIEQIHNIYGSMYCTDSSATQTITSDDVEYAANDIYVAGLSSSEITFNNGDATGRGISSVSDAGGGELRVVSVGNHGYSEGDIVTIFNSPTYNGTYLITSIVSGTEYNINTTFVGSIEGGAYTLRLDGLLVSEAGLYSIDWYVNVYTASTAEFTIGILQNGSPAAQAALDFLFAPTTQNGGNKFLLNLSANDFIQLYLMRTNGTGDIVVKNSVIKLQREA